MAGLDDQVRTNILIMDACRNNPMAPQGGLRRLQTAISRPARAWPRPAALAPARPGARNADRLATAPGQVALDGEGVNSPFSAALRAISARPASKCSRC